MDLEFGINRCKLLYIEWINNKVLLYSTGNYIQDLVIKHNGKEYEKECKYICIYICVCVYIYIHIHTYIYIKLNHFAVQQKLTQHCKSTVLQ